MTSDAKTILKLSIEDKYKAKVIACSKEYLSNSDLVFVMLSTGKIVCFNASGLNE